ncbi:hypothetical protein K458DRAFT_405675 [Lentithecium fluviatile CBS 122367]|uniref:Uncharacterized protein n=1 Tax=Lentithecium fluviatile CBS 122367 TaxID=1168545 RepID=A0A6G1IWU4_9PLEO|nr:hypothetical protein K458DRAFT_405675 [Lentithecium fluviatile CBS 122367]
MTSANSATVHVPSHREGNALSGKKRKLSEGVESVPKSPRAGPSNKLSTILQDDSNYELESDTEPSRWKRGRCTDIRSFPVSVCTSFTSTRITYTSLQATRVPASISALLEQTIAYARVGGRFAFGTRSIGRCVCTCSQNPPVRSKSQECEAACHVCTMQRYTCLLVTEDKRLVLLPLVRGLRGDMATMNDERYWNLGEAARVPKNSWDK